MKLLYIKGSPRGEKSTSAPVADAFLAAYRAKNPQAEIDQIDLWQEPLPEFNPEKAVDAARRPGSGGPPLRVRAPCRARR